MTTKYAGRGKWHSWRFRINIKECDVDKRPQKKITNVKDGGRE